MPGGAALTADEKLQQLLSLLREDGGVPNLGRVPVEPIAPAPLYRPTDEELLHPEAATRAADAAAVAPQEYGLTSETLLAEQEEPDPEPMVDNLDRKIAQRADAVGRMQQPPEVVVDGPGGGASGDVIEDELAMQHVQHASRRPFGEHMREVAQAQAEVASPTPPPAPPPNPTPPSADAPFNRDTRMAEARTAYDSATDDMGNPYSPNFDQREMIGRMPQRGRWEEEFLRGRDPLTDQEIRSRSTMLDNWWGRGAGDKFYDREQRLRAGYDKGLVEARERDIGETRVPPELAEALAATGNISPQRAAMLKMNSPLVQAYVNGMYSQGAGAERIQRMYEQFLLAQQGLDKRADQAATTTKETVATKEAGANYRAEIAAGAREKIAKLRTEQNADPRYLAQWLHSSVPNYSYADARRYALGDDTRRPPVDDSKLELLIDQAALAVTNPKTRQELLAAITARAGETKARSENKFKPAQVKEHREIVLMHGALKRAADAWKSMPDEARKAFVQYGREAPQFLRTMGLGKYQAAAGDLIQVVNEIQRQSAGLSQTVSELQNVREEMGMTADAWDPFRGPEGFERALSRLWKITGDRYREYQRLEPAAEY